LFHSAIVHGARIIMDEDKPKSTQTCVILVKISLDDRSHLSLMMINVGGWNEGLGGAESYVCIVTELPQCFQPAGGG